MPFAVLSRIHGAVEKDELLVDCIPGHHIIKGKAAIVADGDGIGDVLAALDGLAVRLLANIKGEYVHLGKIRGGDRGAILGGG